jgi:hypothetical protein
LKIHSRLSGILACFLLLLFTFNLLQPTRWSLAAALVCFITILILNRQTYSFFLKQKGPLFTIGAIFWHLIYYVYSTCIFAYCWIRYRLIGGKAVSAARIRPRHTA